MQRHVKHKAYVSPHHHDQQRQQSRNAKAHHQNPSMKSRPRPERIQLCTHAKCKRSYKTSSSHNSHSTRNHNRQIRPQGMHTYQQERHMFPIEMARDCTGAMLESGGGCSAAVRQMAVALTTLPALSTANGWKMTPSASLADNLLQPDCIL